MANPADHVTFNSITDNPNIGDERNFVGIRESSAQNLWYDNMTVQSGRTYIVRMYVHNNAAENLNLVAHDVTAKFNLPTTTSTSIQVNGFLSSSNASPTEVYDHAIFSSSENFNLSYVPGSLLFENNSVGANGGVPLSESIFTSTGVRLGYSSLNGDIPGCIQYAGYVSFRVRPQFAPRSAFTVSKKVSKHGTTHNWVKSYTAQPDETVDYLIEYVNTGAVRHDNVTIRDTLPVGQSYVTSSTRYGNSQHPNGVPASDNIANGTGINVGSYSPGANAWAVFSAKIASNDNLPSCGANRLVNSARATVNGGAISDTAVVDVTRVCQPTPPTPVTPTSPTASELPTTGAGDDIGALLGLGSLTTGAGYYQASRRRKLLNKK